MPITSEIYFAYNYIYMATPSDGNLWHGEHEKLEKVTQAKVVLEKIWREKSPVVLLVIGAPGTVRSKLGEWLQQIPRIFFSTRVLYIYTHILYQGIIYFNGTLTCILWRCCFCEL